MKRGARRKFCLYMVLVSLLIFTSCKDPVVKPPKSEVTEIPVVVSPKLRKAIPKGSRIVIANIDGECAQEVKDALMGRLIDNADYDVLARDNLEQILVEADRTWAGRFNTETAVRLGELLGASKFIVGRVLYCGPSLRETDDEEDKAELKILAAIQIIDLETGKVLVSSASEGNYVPRPLPALFPKIALGDKKDGSEEDEESDLSQSEPNRRKRTSKRVKELMQEAKNKIVKSFGKFGNVLGGSFRPKKEEQRIQTEQAYARMKAAEDMANGFADKFFSRPMWETVEMWTNHQWHYGYSIRHVKLGHCQRAVTLLESATDVELPHMSDLDAAKHLHNFGVALLCANQPEKAMSKLRSAYRIANKKTSLNMLGLAGKVQEWSLNVDVDTESVVKTLLERKVFSSQYPLPETQKTMQR